MRARQDKRVVAIRGKAVDVVDSCAAGVRAPPLTAPQRWSSGGDDTMGSLLENKARLLVDLKTPVFMRQDCKPRERKDMILTTKE